MTLSPRTMSAFADETIKLSAHPYTHLGLGAAGAGLAAYGAGRYLYPEQRRERFLVETGQMDPEIYKKRARRRLAEFGAATTAGGALGAATPTLATEAWKRLKKPVQDQVRKSGKKVGKHVRETAQEAGRHAAEGAVAGLRKHRQELGDTAQATGQRYGKGILKGVKDGASGAASKAVNKTMRKAKLKAGGGLQRFLNPKKYYEEVGKRL